MSTELSMLNLPMIFMLFFIIFCIGAYITYKVVNQRKNYVNAIGLQYSTMALALMGLTSLFTILAILFIIPARINQDFFHMYYIEILIFGALFLTFLTSWLYNQFEKNHTTICLYGINPNHKMEFIKNAVAQLGWIDYEIDKEYKRQLVSYSRYFHTIKIREEIFITSDKKKIHVRGSSILFAKLVNTDLEKNYLDGTELDSFKEAFIEVFVNSHPYTIKGWIAFWLFIVGALSSLYLMVSNSFLNLELLFILIFSMSIGLIMCSVFLFSDSSSSPSSEVKR